jgi:hypothetical protein
VPYSCDHSYNNYRWVYDASTQEINSVAGDGFADNPATSYSVTTDSGSVRRFFKLGKTVTLSHDRPWVLEYDTADGNSLILSPLRAPVTLPYILQSGRSYMWVA